ncbi:hypothetical protein AB0O47_39465 [Streptomyces noursei]|uniref:hypothetical protein n=1 Tax=Streptomyces noursei TaxID=1971 RepID=UPI00344E3EB5
MSITHEQLEVWFTFLRDRAEEQGTPQMNRMAGYAYGYGKAMLDTGNEEKAAKKLTWLIDTSEQFKNHANYPGRKAAAPTTPLD